MKDIIAMALTVGVIAAICTLAVRCSSYEKGYNNGKCEIACQGHTYHVYDNGGCQCRIQKEVWVKPEDVK